MDSLRGKWKLRGPLDAVRMAKGGHEYAANAMNGPGTEDEGAVREAVAAAFEENGGTYGYRRLLPEVSASLGIEAGEWAARKIMKERGPAACAPGKKRKYSSHAGEVSEAPENICLDDRGKRHFDAESPNGPWATDMTEFRIPAGKCRLSPAVDCPDGMPIGWPIGTSPDAGLASSSPRQAWAQLKEGERPRGRSGRGGRYRRPGLIAICEEYGIVRSMSRKGCSPDNQRCEGFFGRLKAEFFYGRDWKGVGMDRFMEMLDGYLVW